MASLRVRVLASVLLLSAAGLVALALVTYTEQRSFLEGRVDQQVRSAVPVISQALDRAGYRPSGDRDDNGAATGSHPSTSRLPGSGAAGSGKGAPHANGPGPNLPQGTIAQRREADGHVIHELEGNFSEESKPAKPRLPTHLPLNKLFTVGSVGSTALSYRVFATRDPEDSGITVVAVPLSEVKQTLSRLLLVEGLVIVGVLLALALSASFVVRLGLRPLDRMEITAGEIAAGELSRRVSPATDRTEVGRLGLALNAMLDRLEEAFSERTASEDRLRRFLADASHELRTPLASIRGYAELFRMGATADRDSTEMAMRRIEEESKRMGVLVEDLLTLARLDETPELRREPVDLAVLAEDAVEDARAIAPDRTIELHGHGPALVTGDHHQLRQVLANLTRNALVHTPAGTPIDVSLEQDERTVTVAVRDHGEGLPQTGEDSLFDRFWRAEGGRGRGKAGAGLGLAIAHTVVSAHHGQISAANAPDGGAVFTVRLPKTPPRSLSGSSQAPLTEA